MSAYSSTVRAMLDYLEPVLSQVNDLALERRATQPDACDFRFGNPQEMPLPQIQQALTKWAAPKNKDWFAYKFSDPQAVKVAVESLRRRVGIDFDPRDIAMTTGAFGALASTLRAILDPGQSHGRRFHRLKFDDAGLVVLVEHVGNEHLVEAVPIDIGEINRH